MKLKRIFLFLYLALASTAFSQDDKPQVSIDEKGRKVAVGQLSEQFLLSDSVYSWFKNGMDAYTPDNDAVAFLQRESGNFSVIIYGGTWCSDTQELLPKFYKVAHDADLDINAIKLYGLDADKLGLNKVKPENNIENVPTFIILKDGKEIGRIVETVRSSIEKDIVRILTRPAAEN